jgi:hypothetical protein
MGFVNQYSNTMVRQKNRIKSLIVLMRDIPDPLTRLGLKSMQEKSIFQGHFADSGHSATSELVFNGGRRKLHCA